MFCKDDRFSAPAGQLQKDGSIKAGYWEASSRGVCLITGIDASLAGADKAVASYSSSGTSYGNFIIQGTQSDYRVWSDHQLAAENAKTREGKSPGFYIVNKTRWPVSVSLEQVGCLYYGTIKPGEAFSRETGAVWFTIKANIQPDGKEPRSDWDCAKPVAAIVGSVLAAAATGGYGAFALPGVIAAAGGTMAAATTSTIAIAAASGTVATLAKFGVQQAGELLQENGAGSWKGQYAGPEWPFRCDQKPTYVISGGWNLNKSLDGFVVDPGSELRLTKTNDCGNSMMSTASVSKPELPLPVQKTIALAIPGMPTLEEMNAAVVARDAAAAAQANVSPPPPPQQQVAAGAGYELLFNDKVVSGPDAAAYTFDQARENCTSNKQRQPATIQITCRYNGAAFDVPQQQQVAAGPGYELLFNDKVVSGPDAVGYTLDQARENCAWNKKTQPATIQVACRFNGTVL
jgi:hypothetical protein